MSDVENAILIENAPGLVATSAAPDHAGPAGPPGAISGAKFVRPPLQVGEKPRARPRWSRS